MVGANLYVVGGFINGYKFMAKDTYEFNTVTSTWAKKSSIPASFVGVSHTGNTVDEESGILYLVGGLVLNSGETWPTDARSTKMAFSYHTQQDSWARLPDLPQERGAGVAVMWRKQLHFFNGATFFNGDFQKDYTTHWMLDTNAPPSTHRWVSRASNSVPRNHLGAAAHGDKIYVLGGQLLHKEACTSQVLVEAYDPMTNKWHRVADLPEGLGHIAPATFGTKHGIMVVGGVVDHTEKCKDPKMGAMLATQILLYVYANCNRPLFS